MKRADPKKIAKLVADWQDDAEHGQPLWAGAAKFIVYVLTHYRGKRRLDMLKRQAILCEKMTVSGSFWRAYNEVRDIHGLRWQERRKAVKA